MPKGQWEAARSTGLSFTQTLAFVVLPQAMRLGIPPLTNRTIAITKNTALGTVIGVGEILSQATTAQSFSGNATPLMMGAIAYIVLFVPVVMAGALDRDALCLAEGLMDLILQQFFNVDIMRKVWPLLLRGLGTTAYPVRAGHSARASLAACWCRCCRSRSRALVRWSAAVADRPVPRRSAAGAADLALFRAAVRRHPPVAAAAVCRRLLLNTSSYYGEIYRAGIESVGRGQWEAARSTGLSACADARLTWSCRRRCATCCPTSSPTPSRSSSSPRSPAWWRCPNCSIPPTWRARSPSTHPRRAGRGHLSCHTVAGGAAGQPAGAARWPRTDYRMRRKACMSRIVTVAAAQLGRHPEGG